MCAVPDGIRSTNWSLRYVVLINFMRINIGLCVWQELIAEITKQNRKQNGFTSEWATFKRSTRSHLIHFSGVFSRLRLFLTKFSVQREKWLVFRWYRRTNAMRATRRQTFCAPAPALAISCSVCVSVIATLAVMSYDSTVQNPFIQLLFCCFWLFFFFVEISFLFLFLSLVLFSSPFNCVCVFIGLVAFGRLQNIGHLKNLCLCVTNEACNLDFISNIICMHAQCKWDSDPQHKRNLNFSRAILCIAQSFRLHTDIHYANRSTWISIEFLPLAHISSMPR